MRYYFNQKSGNKFIYLFGQKHEWNWNNVEIQNKKQQTKKKKHKIPQTKSFSVMIKTSIDKSFLAPTYVTKSTFPPLSDLGHKVEHVSLSSPET